MEKPFSPAVNAAMNLLSQVFQRDTRQVLTEEAQYLALPEGAQPDVQRRVWVLPEPAEPAA